MFYALVVDADVGFRQALSDILCAYLPLIDVEDVGDWAEALNKVECTRPNIVFMDIQLPGKSGFELTEAL